MRQLLEDKMKHALPDLPVPVEVGMGVGRIGWRLINFEKRKR